MLDGLLVSSQHIPEGFWDSPVRRGDVGSRLGPGDPGRIGGGHSVSPLVILEGHQALLAGAGQMINTAELGLVFHRPARHDASGVLSGRERGLRAINILRERTRRSLELEQNERELNWVAENRHRFRVLWIAVPGDKLLATGKTAKEVFGKVSNQATAPLVIRVKDEDRPFAGW